MNPPLQCVPASHFRESLEICQEYVEGFSDKPVVQTVSVWMYKNRPILMKVENHSTETTAYFAVSKSLEHQATCGHPIPRWEFLHDAKISGDGSNAGQLRCGKCKKQLKEYASFDALLDDFCGWLQDIATQPDGDTLKDQRITKREARLILKAMPKSKGL